MRKELHRKKKKKQRQKSHGYVFLNNIAGAPSVTLAKANTKYAEI